MDGMSALKAEDLPHAKESHAVLENGRTRLQLPDRQTPCAVPGIRDDDSEQQKHSVNSIVHGRSGEYQ